MVLTDLLNKQIRFKARQMICKVNGPISVT